MPPDYFFAMPTRELNDFGEGFVGLVRLVAARTRSPRKSPDGDVCCPLRRELWLYNLSRADRAPDPEITK